MPVPRKQNRQTKNKEETIPDICLPLIGQNFVKNYVSLQENLAKHTAISLSPQIWGFVSKNIGGE